MQRFRGGLELKAHRLLFHSTLGWRVIKKQMNIENLTGSKHRLEGRVANVEQMCRGILLIRNRR